MLSFTLKVGDANKDEKRSAPIDRPPGIVQTDVSVPTMLLRHGAEVWLEACSHVRGVDGVHVSRVQELVVHRDQNSESVHQGVLIQHTLHRSYTHTHAHTHTPPSAVVPAGRRRVVFFGKYSPGVEDFSDTAPQGGASSSSLKLLSWIIKFTSMKASDPSPTDLSGLGLRLALAWRAEARRRRGVWDWTAGSGRAHGQRRVLRPLLLVAKKSQRVKHTHRTGCTEEPSSSLKPPKPEAGRSKLNGRGERSAGLAGGGGGGGLRLAGGTSSRLEGLLWSMRRVAGGNRGSSGAERLPCSREGNFLRRRSDPESDHSHSEEPDGGAESALPAAFLAVVEQAQRRGADGERARREPGQQAEPALLAAAIFGVRVRLFLVIVVFILGRFCFREKTVSSETTVAAAALRGVSRAVHGNREASPRGLERQRGGGFTAQRLVLLVLMTWRCKAHQSPYRAAVLTSVDVVITAGREPKEASVNQTM
ncbi:hypothetical protein EYF80_042142 [Liparis tanakae]|uniref:Uncharacterized protein n=1 Tax=Liparis tanakae TaxID=230148 RepID=A0A4Z2G4Z4_9TELE|nr:hypothetical protein EYF80_042142 [Liparis tanakae]